VRSAGAAALMALAACQDGARPEHEPTGAQASAIIDGVADGQEHDSVVLISIHAPEGIGACTGTMVAPNLVLTARHCVSETDEGSACKADGTAYSGAAIKSDIASKDLLVYTGRRAIAGVENAGEAAARGKAVFVETTSVLCDRDVAFILLDHA